MNGRRGARDRGVWSLASTGRDFDYILTMDEENYRAVAALCQKGSAEVRPFLDYAPEPVSRPRSPIPSTAGLRALSTF